MTKKKIKDNFDSQTLQFPFGSYIGILGLTGFITVKHSTLVAHDETSILNSLYLEARCAIQTCKGLWPHSQENKLVCVKCTALAKPLRIKITQCFHLPVWKYMPFIPSYQTIPAH